MKVVIKELIKDLVVIQEEKSWIGTNFKRQIDGLSEEEFFHRSKELHSIAEIIAHLSTWRKEAVLKLKTGKGSITDSDPSNWQSPESLRQVGKNQIMADYRESLEQIIQVLHLKNDTFLKETYFDTDFKGYYPYSFLLKGILHHDLYHLGQIGLICKLIKNQ